MSVLKTPEGIVVGVLYRCLNGDRSVKLCVYNGAAFDFPNFGDEMVQWADGTRFYYQNCNAALWEEIDVPYP